MAGRHAVAPESASPDGRAPAAAPRALAQPAEKSLCTHGPRRKRAREGPPRRPATAPQLRHALVGPPPRVLPVADRDAVVRCVTVRQLHTQWCVGHIVA